MSRIYCDGFLKDKKFGEVGCSVGMLKNRQVLFVKRYYMKDSKNTFIQKFFRKERITVPIVEYFAIYRAILIAKKFSVNLIFSDSELVVNQINGVYETNKRELLLWKKLCIRLLENTDISILWASRLANLKILGH